MPDPRANQMVLFMQIGTAIAELAKTSPPDALIPMLLGIVVNGVDEIPDDTWREVDRATGRPCGKPACTCHEDARRAFVMLDELRTKARAKRAGKRADG